VWLTVRLPESVTLLEAFMASDMAEGCRLLSPAEARGRFPQLPRRHCWRFWRAPRSCE